MCWATPSPPSSSRVSAAPRRPATTISNAPCSKWPERLRLPHRRIERTAVEQQVLADDKPRRGGAQEGAGVAEFGRVADAAGRGPLPGLHQLLLERDVLPPRLEFDPGAQPVGEERPRQQPVDRDVVLGDLTG